MYEINPVFSTYLPVLSVFQNPSLSGFTYVPMVCTFLFSGKSYIVRESSGCRGICASFFPEMRISSQARKSFLCASFIAWVLGQKDRSEVRLLV